MTASSNAKSPTSTPSKSTYIPSIPTAHLAVTALRKPEQKRRLSSWKHIKVNKKNLAVAALGLALAGCQGGANHKADVYTAAELNQKIDTQLVNILAITPAQIEVDNSQNKKAATVFGSILGGVIGAQNSGRHQGQSTVVGASAGGAMGSLVSHTQLVDGVQLSYQDNGKLVTSVQVGSLCEFKIGQAVSLLTRENKTRIQPNATCLQGDK